MTRTACSVASIAMLVASQLSAQRDSSPKIQFIQVEQGVKLEVLDWGGTGRPVVLLAGNTRTAHDFDEFAPTLTASYHVYGVTRRGFGASSAPADGYSADRLGNDVLAVIDTLGLVRPVLAGHSLAGEELSSIGSRHPEKVAGLVYLDAAYGYAFYSPGNFETDANELRRGLEQLHLAAANGNVEEVRRLISRLLTTDLPALDQSLRLVERDTPAASTNPPTRLMPPPAVGVSRLLYEGTQRYTDVHVPVLAIYAAQGMPAAVAADSAAAAAWLAERVPASRVIRSASPNVRVVILANATHDVFRSNEPDVLREMHVFIAGLPVR